MDLFCKVFDRSIIADGIFIDFITPSRKKIDNSLSIKYVINNVILDEVDKNLKDYISTQITKF